MSLGLSQALRDARALVIRDAIDAGPGSATLTIYVGPRPCATLAAPGTLQFATVSDDLNANNSGLAAWFRITNSLGVAVMDGSVGLEGATLNLNNVSFTAGRKVRVVSFVLVEGNS